MNETIRLERIDNEHNIDITTDPVFLFELHRSLLLDLKVRGRLSEVQYRHAEEKLRKQSRCSTKADAPE